MRFIAFVALISALGKINLMVLLTGIGLALAIVAVMHILATPEHHDA